MGHLVLATYYIYVRTLHVIDLLEETARTHVSFTHAVLEYVDSSRSK
jgi:hypothetical protein